MSGILTKLRRDRAFSFRSGLTFTRLFATKPYLCGSNYLWKMVDHRTPRAGETDWCEILDGLYWRFIDRHREFFAGQARLNRTVALGSLDLRCEANRAPRRGGRRH